MPFYLIVLGVLLLIYFPWFDLGKTLSSGDWPYLFLQNIQTFKIPTETPFLWLEPYYQITAKLGVQVFSLPWEVTEKIFWFFPFLLICLISSYFFLKYLSKQFMVVARQSVIFIAVGSLIFTTNTYILMLVGGGQMGVAIAYSLIPAVLQRVFSIMNDSKFDKKDFILSSLILGAQLMFDPRIFSLSMLIVFLYILFRVGDFNTKFLKKIMLVLAAAVIVNLFWIMPNVNYFNTEYKSAIDAANASFLSFATFSNSVSLYHPNWPENIFGKIGFMRAEFIALPILAFFTLFFANKKKIILFFAFLGLFGAVLAKGTNPPFGELYVWLSNVPGFSAFRDPTKFYVLIVLSYMVLIPLSLCKLAERVSNIKYRKLSIFALIFLAYWLFLIRPAVFGQLTGTFSPYTVPKEYVSLKDFLNSQPEFTKTLWVPTIERFGFNSRIRPAISAMDIFGVSSVSGVLNKLSNPEAEKQLLDEEVKYVIVPYDYLQEIFLTDRKYDNNLYVEAIEKLKGINWLSEVKNNNFGKVKVFELIKF